MAAIVNLKLTVADLDAIREFIAVEERHLTKEHEFVSAEWRALESSANRDEYAKKILEIERQLHQLANLKRVFS